MKESGAAVGLYLSTFEDEAFICGLPETLLDIALLWLPAGPLRERKKHRNDDAFPSWSWTGWVGPVHYPSYLPSSRDIHSEITRWAIETSNGSHELYVNASYITTGASNAKDAQKPDDKPTIPRRPFTPSPWRKTLKHADHSISEDKISSPINPLRSRIQTGTLSFETRLATFWILDDPPPSRPTLPRPLNPHAAHVGSSIRAMHAPASRQYSAGSAPFYSRVHTPRHCRRYHRVNS